MPTRPIVRIAIGLLSLMGELNGGVLARPVLLEIVLDLAITVASVWLIVTGVRALTASRRAKSA